MNQDVKEAVYQAVEEACGADYAFSYLIRARQIGTVIIPHTVVAWERLTQNPNAMHALRAVGCTLRKPEPWSPTRDRAAIYSQAA